MQTRRQTRRQRQARAALFNDAAEVAMGLMMCAGVLGWLFTFLFVATN